MYVGARGVTLSSSRCCGNLDLRSALPAPGTLDQVKEMHDVWHDQLQMSFGINKVQLRQMITSCKFAEGLDFTPLVETTWKSLNPDGAEL